MINFYPGPSRVYGKIPEYITDAYREGILSVNHRSKPFMALMESTMRILKKRLAVPDNYEVFFVSSATECWEVIAQSLGGYSYHFHTGSFGQKWLTATQKLKKETIGYHYDREKELKVHEIDLSSEAGTICITHNETSNGTKVSDKLISKLAKKYPEHLIAVDATSSMAGVTIDFSSADIWFASVQKCFGLPAGLAVMICSPKAIEKAITEGQFRQYNSLANIIVNARKLQTTHTPNIMAIYLLNRTLKARKNILSINNKLEQRYDAYIKALEDKNDVELLISNSKVRSKTVVVVKGEDKNIESIMKKATEHGIILGKGYGDLKNTTFRIANFPAIKKSEHQMLLKFLNDNVA